MRTVYTAAVWLWLLSVFVCWWTLKKTTLGNYSGAFLNVSRLTTRGPDWDLNGNFTVNSMAVLSQYTISPKPCKEFSVPPFLLFITFSRTTAFKQRQAMRKTWGSLASPVCGARLLFIFGRVYDRSVQRRLETEAASYGDVIQSNQFDDLYRGATEKALQLLQWSAAFCPESVFTVKVDDDTWVNLPAYFEYLQENQDGDHIWGSWHGESVVRRDPDVKFFVPREEYGNDTYPEEYLDGLLYAIPTRLIPKILHASRRVPRTFNDDVYVTGLLAADANLTQMDIPLTWMWDYKEEKNDTVCHKKDAICIHKCQPEDFFALWKDPCHVYDELC